MIEPLPDEIDEAFWDDAYHRADAIQGFLDRYPDRSSATGVDELATELASVGPWATAGHDYAAREVNC